MRAEARRFEEVWAAHEGGALPTAPLTRVAALVAVAEEIRTLPAEGRPAPAAAAWNRLAAELEVPHVPHRGREHVVLQPRRPARRMVLRVAAAVVALFAGVASVSLHAHPGSLLYPLRTSLEETALLLSPDDGPLHLRIAEARLGDLVHALRQGPHADAPGEAEALVQQRAAAARSGQDVRSLDAGIRLQVPPALESVPLSISARVRSILGPLLPSLSRRSEVPAVTGAGITPEAEGEHGGSSGQTGGGRSSGSETTTSSDTSGGDSGGATSGSGGDSGSGSDGSDSGTSTSGSDGGGTSGDGGTITSGSGDSGSGTDGGSSTSGSGDSGSGIDGGTSTDGGSSSSPAPGGD